MAKSIHVKVEYKDMSERYENSIFWIEVEKIKPNPFQPRREFDEKKLKDLAESIRQYGVLQPLVVSRREVTREDGGLSVEYELIAGERRLRASKLAGLGQIPAVIKPCSEDDERLKLEIAIIENLQREDLNPIDRARAFAQLVNEFRLTHVDVAKKIGKSREYVSNSIRILALPQDILDALMERRITEGHTKPILMLADRPEEQHTLFKEVVYKKLTVRDTEDIARRIAYDRVRKKSRFVDPDMIALESKLGEKLGARVHVEGRENTGGKVTIDFFTENDLRRVLLALERVTEDNLPPANAELGNNDISDRQTEGELPVEETETVNHSGDDSEKPPEEPEYFVKNFSI